jgi:hypothetical protein
MLVLFNVLLTDVNVNELLEGIIRINMYYVPIVLNELLLPARIMIRLGSLMRGLPTGDPNSKGSPYLSHKPCFQTSNPRDSPWP